MTCHIDVFSLFRSKNHTKLYHYSQKILSFEYLALDCMKNFPHVFSILIKENTSSRNIFIKVFSRKRNCIIFKISKMQGGVVGTLHCKL